jgi:3'-phosphoadenosine 5'-phosphosulfate sulfotransferase (PAPS reductase)/FAD synthetase
MPLNENNIIKNDTGRYPNEDSGFFHAQNQYHAVSLSGGKDSTALLLLMIERGMPIDAVISADTGMEFPEMYDHLAKVDDYLFRERGIHVTTLRHPHGFEWLMFEEPKQKKSSLENRARMGVPPYGNGWPGIRVRWCTGQLKTHLITKEVNRLKKEKNALHYVGIAADEAWRCKGEVYPLVEWGITEAEALQACYDRGFDFGGLYEIYHRASCWCCPFQRIDELRKLRQHHPALWAKLLDLDNRAIAQFGDNPLGKFKQNWTVAALDARFAAESAA